MLKFKSKGMQWCSYFYIGNDTSLLRKIQQTNYSNKICKRIGYYTPEERVEKEQCEVLYDSERVLVLLTPDKMICQFENNF